MPAYFDLDSYSTPTPVSGSTKWRQDKKLFTPGPLGCSLTTKQAMLKDLGSRDKDFIQTIKNIRQQLLDVAGVDSREWTTVLMQGSGSFAVEAVLQTTTPRTGGKVLVLANGAYGKRMKLMCDTAGLDCQLEIFSETEAIDVQHVEKLLKSKQKYSTIAIVHCETSSGVMNCVKEVGEVVRMHQPTANYFVDAMSSFGAVPLNLDNVDFVVSSANKCLQGVPGFSYAICRRSSLSRCKGNSRSLSLDLVDQDTVMDKTGQFRFTPPTHALLAFQQAIKEFYQEGGLKGRSSRYKCNREVLRKGMADMGFKELVPEEFAGYIITCFYYPDHQNFSFETFYTKLSDLDQVIYPGKVTTAPCFRIGNIGNLQAKDMERLLICIKRVLNEMKVPLPDSGPSCLSMAFE